MSAAPTTPGLVGAVKDVTKVQCTADKAGKWSFTGTITNPDKTPQKYTVSASVVTTQGWTVQGGKDIVVVVQPGKSAPAAAEGFYTSPKGNTAGQQCVTRVVRMPA